MLTRGGAKVLHLHSRLNFKLNRAAALTEWRQLCSALVPAFAVVCQGQDVCKADFKSQFGDSKFVPHGAVRRIC